MARIHITGASGAGVSTLGEALAERLGAAWLESDDIYWMEDAVDYAVKRDRADRLWLLGKLLEKNPRAVSSGSLDSWGGPLLPWFDLVVFVDAPTAVRLARLERRERGRYGAAIDPGGARHALHLDFMDFSAGYDEGRRPGRSRTRHEAWLATLNQPVLRLDGARPTPELVEAVLARLRSCPGGDRS